MRGAQIARPAIFALLISGFIFNTLNLFVCDTAASAQSSQSQSMDEPPVLKPDTPKLDTTSPLPSRTLKGGVQHRALSNHESSKKLSSGVLDVFKKKNKTKLNGQTAKVDANSLLRSGANSNNNALTSTIQEGIGIIGVKFLLSFGHMPVINRVFPGTPAYTMGLHARDIIVAVDGVPTLGLSKEDVYGMIVGKPDTEVTISIKRGGEFIAKTLKRMDFNDIPDPLVRQDYLMSI